MGYRILSLGGERDERRRRRSGIKLLDRGSWTLLP